VKPFLGGLLLRLFTSILLPFSILLFGFAVAAISVHENAMRGLVAERDARSARAAAAAMSELLLHRRIAVRDLALRLEDGIAAQEVIKEGEPIAHSFDEGLAVVSRNGKILAGSLSPSLIGSPLFRRALASLKSEAESSHSVFMVDGGLITTAVPAGGSLLVMGFFSAKELLLFALPDLDSPPMRASAVIVDPQAGVLANIGALPLEPDYRDHAGIRAAMEGKSGSSLVNSAKGEEHVLAFSPISYAGWVLLIEEPWHSVASPLLRLSLSFPLALGLALAISLFGLWFASRRIVLPLRRLQQVSLKLAAGDFEAINVKVGGVQEVRDLQNSMAVMARRIHHAQQSLRRYIGEVTVAQEEERRRLSQDLHDETIQDLIALDQKIQLLARSPGRGKRPKITGLQEIHQAAQEVIQRVRRLSRALRPAYLEDLGLMPALEALSQDVGSSLGIPIVMRVVGRLRRLSHDAELAIYRIVQEALANIARHAAARHAWIVLRYGKEGLQVIVKDDGSGFTPPPEPAELSRSGHFGLIGMRERAQYIDARVEVHSAPGKGARVTICLPLPK